MSQHIKRKDWAVDPDLWRGDWQGGNAGLSIIFSTQTKPGGGPRLHTHPYPEVFIIRSGHGQFTVGDQLIEPEAGDILVVPADTPHKFTNLGPDMLESINIHVSGEFITDWLE